MNIKFDSKRKKVSDENYDSLSGFFSRLNEVTVYLKEMVKSVNKPNEFEQWFKKAYETDSRSLWIWYQCNQKNVQKYSYINILFKYNFKEAI